MPGSSDRSEPVESMLRVLCGNASHGQRDGGALLLPTLEKNLAAAQAFLHSLLSVTPRRLLGSICRTLEGCRGRPSHVCFPPPYFALVSCKVAVSPCIGVFLACAVSHEGPLLGQ